MAPLFATSDRSRPEKDAFTAAASRHRQPISTPNCALNDPPHTRRGKLSPIRAGGSEGWTGSESGIHCCSAARRDHGTRALDRHRYALHLRIGLRFGRRPLPSPDRCGMPDGRAVIRGAGQRPVHAYGHRNSANHAKACEKTDSLRTCETLHQIEDGDEPVVPFVEGTDLHGEEREQVPLENASRCLIRNRPRA